MPMLNLDGSSLHYTVKGSGTPIVFIHPPVLTSVNFKYQLEELSQNFQVITFDIRGHGRSPYSPEPVTYPLIVKDINRLLDHLNISKAFLCGYSTGGSIVLEYMLSFTERALGGISIGAMADVNDDYLRKKISLGIKLSSKGAISFLAWSISWSNSNNIKLFKQMFSEARKGDYRNIEQYYRYSLKYNCVSQLAEIHLPILLVYGKKDKPFHSYAEQLHEKLPRNQLHFIEKVDHRIPTKAAKQLNNLIRQFVNN
ncbi:alpha/beta hydrolase [Aeromicrobium ponti]|uniref:Pimeloyl-ACP methyl ester carboxylesterase n=1 Tax=Cytobacillus oceanisediminis TaxID=665099 RepID=A0A562K758_9BACI|nr:alpha/beta hydrolase [Cytobacillus oceanisediminis]TWH91247.1 pimeloyl-ACP methyl ester carboxylesterase [Cytobacillus oceanisediminis]